MKKFVLKSKLGESIALNYSDDISEAEEFFAIMKNLKLNDLLRIFIVEEAI